MATTVDITKFDSAFQQHPNFNGIITQINQSPTLVDAINSFTGEIKQGDPNSGGYFDPNTNEINIAVDWINDTVGNQAFQDKFVTMIGHEIGHAVLPNGYGDPSPPINPQESMQSGLNNEGVAITMEYKIAHELNVPMWSDNHTGSVKASFDALANQHPIGTAEFDAAGEVLGAQTYAGFNPSIAPNLNYQDYYLGAAVVNMCTGSPGDFNSINWQTAQPGDIVFTNNQDGSCTYTGTLPTLSGAAGAAAGLININASFPLMEQEKQINIEPKADLTETLKNQQSSEIKALHEKIGGFLYPALEKSNVNQNHADAMVATAVQQAVQKNIGADDVMHVGIDKSKNLIGVFTNEAHKVAAFDAVEASKNNPEKILEEAQ